MQRRRVAACQVLTDGNLMAGAEMVVDYLTEAKDRQVDLTAFPEGTLFGYDCSPDYWAERSPEEFAAAEARVGAACRALRMAAVVGSASRVSGRWRNECVAFDADGEIRARYGKTYLAGERWCEANPGPLPVVDLAGMPCCFIICHDVRYPELVRLPVMAGAKLCVFCSNESGLLEEHKLSAYRAMPVARATENDIYLVMANTPADPRDLARPGQSHGNSKIVDPRGVIMEEAGFTYQGLILADIDLDQARRQWPLRSLDRGSTGAAWWHEGLAMVSRR